MNSPRFAPAGLLVVAPRGRGLAPIRIAFDGGGDADLGGPLDAWLVTDARAELIAAIRRRGRELSVTPVIGSFVERAQDVPRLVRHTNHPTYAYELRWRGRCVVWAPEFWRVPGWVADLFFADAAGWSRPIAFAHLGRPTIRAIDEGLRPPFGEFGREGQIFRMTPSRFSPSPGRSSSTSGNARYQKPRRPLS